jgi:Xaa-Pro aminopeptidase
MDADEVKWLDSYHARVRKILAPLVDTTTRRWLAAATRRLETARGKR